MFQLDQYAQILSVSNMSWLQQLSMPLSFEQTLPTYSLREAFISRQQQNEADRQLLPGRLGKDVQVVRMLSSCTANKPLLTRLASFDTAFKSIETLTQHADIAKHHEVASCIHKACTKTITFNMPGQTYAWNASDEGNTAQHRMKARTHLQALQHG